jgi:dephospho-CoA kinase
MTVALRIALTGGIGSGKSTVTSKFQKLGTPVIDSDVISRDIVKPNSACLEWIINEFGVAILNDDKTLNRQKLRNIIFNDKNAKQKLEGILHPTIYQEIEKQLSKINHPYCLIVIPLLIETQAMEHFDRILLIDTSQDLQISRASNRDKISHEMVETIIKSQASREQRLKYADDIINNNVRIEELNAIVLELHEKYLKLSSYNH